MLSDEVIEKVIERLVNRIENVNLYVLKKIGKTIKKMGILNPSDTKTLIEIMNFGGDYKKIVKELAKVTKLNQKEIYDIFEEVAKTDYQFAKQFYKYRNKQYIPYAFNKQLQEQVQAIARATAETYQNISKSLAFSRKVKGKVVYSSIGETYQNVIDEGLIAMNQSKDTFNQVMKKAIKELASSGIRSVDWESGISRSLEYAVRMNLRDGIRTLHNETQQIIAEDIGADGVEISVHSFPAPDHQYAQGKQFRLEEFNKLQETGKAKDYEGKEINLHRHLIRKDKDAESFRPISKMNCYHYDFSIILGVNKPQYTNEQLQEIIEINNKGFDYGGKHYSMYEGTQLQRKIENEIRKQKYTQIMAKESGEDDLVQESQKNINSLVKEYHNLSKVSGLSTKLERMQVDGYKEVDVIETPKVETPKPKEKKLDIKINTKQDLLNKWNKEFENDNIEVKHILNAEPKLIDEQIDQVDNLLVKYKFVKDDINKDSELNALIIQVNTGDIMGEKNYARFFGGHYIEFNEKYFKDKSTLIDEVKGKISKNWWQDVNIDKYNVYPVTHEFGHLLEYKMIENIEYANGFKGDLMRGDYMQGDLKIQREILKKVPDLDKYLSDYGKSTPRFEWFAETFAQMELGNETPVTKALKEYIEEFEGGNYGYFR